MRSAAERIRRFNAGFRKRLLYNKLDKLAASPFVFFRGTYHLFADDLRDGPFRKAPAATPAGPIVGDLHTGNFGSFRAVTGDIVYDINDFDETTGAPYEYDLRRLSASLVLAAHDGGLRLGDGVNAAESAVRAYIEALGRQSSFKDRKQFEDLAEARNVLDLLRDAEERQRAEFMQGIATQNFEFKAGHEYLAVKEKERTEALRALPEYLKHCLAPSGARPERYRFLDIATRIAGCGSLGRARYALLLGKGRKSGETYSTVRLIEWKQALDPGSTSAGPKRARRVTEAAQAFQLYPKRYLGYTAMFGAPMQAREIGSNDLRFNHKHFCHAGKLAKAAAVFGSVTARAHLLASLDEAGPRFLRREKDSFVRRILTFGVDYAGRAIEDHGEFVKAGKASHTPPPQ